MFLNVHTKCAEVKEKQVIYVDPYGERSKMITKIKKQWK